ncbi:MAG: aspartate aminotransferase family protein [Candidatus Hydrogenedentes bacterium]|nr:aspartate aminotransferase family protein [Candidatus Hydrogenedentota bacterium]
MTQSIQHENEPRANALRARLDTINGIGQRTYTPTQIVVSRARGVRLWTVDGVELIDFTSGVLVSNLGHNHPLFEERYSHYCAELPRTSYNALTEIEVEAAERLVKCMNMSGPRKLLWAASGSEGIQKAMWCALHKKPDCPIMLASRGGFHGKKGLAGDVSGETSPNPNVRFISFPMQEEKPASFYESELDAIAKECGNKIALLITEPYLGAKGSWHPPKWYHKLLQDWCRANDVAYIFDEVQSCHGRTGNMFAYQSYEVEPDLVVLGKGLANGEPAAAVVGRADLIDSLTYGEASDTFSGNPHACAAVCATLDVFEKENIVENCRAMAKVIGVHMCEAMKKFSFIKAVRGEGLVYGIEMSDDATAQRAVLEAYRGVNEKGVHFLGPLAGKVLRVSPPLTITEKDLDDAFSVLNQAWVRI